MGMYCKYKYIGLKRGLWKEISVLFWKFYV